MSTITVEGSFEASNADQGKTHEEIHKDQHNYLQAGEPLVEEITNTSLDDDCVDLALKKAQELGIKTPEEWAKSNAKERHKSRRTNSYDEYLQKVARNVVDHKQAALNSKDTSSATRNKLRRELSYIKQNRGIPIYSTLYYVGSVKDYEGKTPDEIKLIRKAKAETLRTFFNSDYYRQLHPGLTTSEIHYDERGDLHGQNQEVFVNKRKNGYAEFAQRAVIKKRLIARFGGGDKGKKDLNRRIDLLIYAHSVTKSKDAGDDRIGDARADAKYLSWALSGKKVKPKVRKKYSQKERDVRIVELARIEDMFWLNKAAEATFAKYGLPWKLDTSYTTDGQHETAKEYTERLNADRKLAATQQAIKENDKTISKQQKQLDDIKKTLTDTKKSLTDAETALKDNQQHYASVHAKLQTDKDEQAAILQELPTLRKQHDDAKVKADDMAQRLAQVRQQVQQEEQRRRQRKRELDVREKALTDRESAVKQSSDQLDKRTKSLDERTQNVQKQEQSITVQLQQLHRREDDLAKREAKVQQREGFFKHFAKALVFWMKQVLKNEFDELHKTAVAEVTAEQQGKQEEALHLQQREQQQREALREKALKTKNVFKATTRARFSDIDSKDQNEEQQAFSDDLHDKISKVATDGDPDAPIDKAADEVKKYNDDGDDLEF